MENQKSFEFNGTPGGYFLVTLVSLITAYIPIFGWPISFNYSMDYIVKNSRINGRSLKYSAGYGETLGFLVVNLLLVLVTLGIYIFWFGPKTYRFVADHSSFADETPAVAPVEPVAAVPPVAPTVQG